MTAISSLSKAKQIKLCLQRLNKKLLKSSEVVTQWLMVHLLLLSSASHKSGLLHYVAQMLCSSTARNHPLFAEWYFSSRAFLNPTGAVEPRIPVETGDLSK